MVAVSANIAKLVLTGLKQASNSVDVGLQSATLIKLTPGTRTPGALSAGTNPTSTSYACSALIEVLSINDVPTTIIEANDRKIGILGASLAAGIIPGSNDRVTMKDLDGTTKTFRLIAAVSGDGVGAMYEFVARV